ncbi:PepSY-associated TM helix domain-containing protein [Novosphingobium malaysiense]|uniref:Peptidase n=1 Tax=Novosphingobium malaysiense TaxID=1348853 RepID=A0A0B1ZV47_9SPHN|nr:PepSY-associated TM helix domain-containing protein [Novosphingobium malaysiense]KHK93329.1 peptidase [Novosphingobium malaysiense]
MSASPPPSTVKRALASHAAVGLVAGALLYLVCLTGTISVFYAELQRLEQPDAPEMSEIAPSAAQRAVTAVLATERPATEHLYVHLPVSDLPRTTITTDNRAVHVAADGSLAGPEEIAWSDFLVALHYELNVPGLVGLTVVGALGAMILALVISGLVAHPRIFRDAFRLRARDAGGIGLADWHNRLSVWTLPFSIAIALTGAMIGLASVTAYGIASFYHDGDLEAVYAPLFGEEGPKDESPAPAPNVARALAYMQTHYPSVTPIYAFVHEPLTRGQTIQIWAKHPRRLIFAEYYHFDADGAFRHTTGLADGKLGQQLAASAYDLHFGNYGGLPVKLAYVLFGTALTAICATGIYIWLGKRRRRGLNEPRLRKTWDAVVWGSPLLVALTLAVRLAFGNAAPFVALFWSGFAVILAAALLPLPPERFRRWLFGLLAMACGGVVILSI